MTVPKPLLAGGLAGLLLALVTAALASGRADAHGVQVASDPPPGAQLIETPDLITVTFSEPIEPSVSTVQLWDQAGQQVMLQSNRIETLMVDANEQPNL